MIGFHIDMNMAQYRADYLNRWLHELARSGFDTILWEVENNVAWETCPECASPDAFSKETFREILAGCRALGLKPVPLLQTIGHAEYVLKHTPYLHLRELPNRIDQYCPRNPALLPFLHQWIEEYLDVFGQVAHFHIGADEAHILGACPRCRAYAQEHSLSRLYIDHVNAVAEPLIRRGITPIIWADMVLHHPEALDTLSREVMLFDWMYATYRGNGPVWVWGEGMRGKEDLSEKTRALFGPYLFPAGDEPGREPETFYSADFLADKGFRVVTCPSSSSYGDNVFSPRTWLHLVNTFDSVQKGMSANLCGSLLTSWSVHLFPWELQLACIDLPGYLFANPRATLADFQAWFVEERFGVADDTFWKACGLLSKPCLFTYTASLGYDKTCLPAPEAHVRQVLGRIQEQNGLDEEMWACRARQAEYREALQCFETFAQRATRGKPYLDMWSLAARNLLNRARTSELLLRHAGAVTAAQPLTGPDRGAAGEILAEMRALRGETEALYRTMIRPTRKDEVIAYMYAAVERAVAGLAGGGGDGGGVCLNCLADVGATGATSFKVRHLTVQFIGGNATGTVVD